MKLIDKSALVAEIERRRKDWRYGGSIEAKYKSEECDDILYFLETIATREVNLENEVEDWVKTGPHTSYPWCTIPDAIRITAEHFFELGLKAKGE